MDLNMGYEGFLPEASPLAVMATSDLNTFELMVTYYGLVAKTLNLVVNVASSVFLFGTSFFVLMCPNKLETGEIFVTTLLLMPSSLITCNNQPEPVFNERGYPSGGDGGNLLGPLFFYMSIPITMIPLIPAAFVFIWIVVDFFHAIQGNIPEEPFFGLLWNIYPWTDFWATVDVMVRDKYFSVPLIIGYLLFYGLLGLAWIAMYYEFKQR